jgi:drug/metabolite transporter (DMT)-like permease
VSRYRAVALFLGLGLLWGGSFPAIEVGLESFPPVLFAAVRYDLAGVVLLAYAVVAADRWLPRDRTDLLALGAAGVFLIAGNSLLFVGQQFTTGGVASIIYSLIPILTTGFAWGLLPEERLSPTGLVGILIGLAGVAVIVRPDPANLLATGVIGEAFVTGAAISVSLGSVLLRRLDSSLPDSAFTAWAMLIGASLLHLGSLGVGESLAAVRFAPAGLLALAYIAVFATAAAFLIYFFLLGAYGPLETNLVSYVVPVVATLLGWAYLDEPITAWTIAGFLLIFGGFVVLKRRALRAELRGILGGQAA